MTRVAGIIVNLVPYHHARWEVFARSSKLECQLVELTDQDTFKVLEFSGAASYQRHTLFPRDGSEIPSVKSLRREMASKLNALQPDVVCVSGWALPVSLAALAWALTTRVPAVVLSESNEFDEPRAAVKEFVKRQIVGLCSAGLAGGTPQADYLANLGLPRASIFQGYDVVDNRHFEDKAAEVRGQQSEVRSKHELPEKYFLACARFGEKKNLPRLIEAYALYRQKAATLKPEARKSEKLKEEQFQLSAFSFSTFAPWDLVIAGDGEKRAEIEAAIRRFGVTDSVHLVGAKSYAEMPVLYGLASAFVHASTTEQWGLVVNEAMASGLPVLVSNRCGCAQDLVQEGVNGFAFDPYDVEQLTQLMLRISDFRFPISDFGAASARIVADWGPERFASGLKAAVDCALKTKARHPTLLDHLLVRLMPAS